MYKRLYVIGAAAYMVMLALSLIFYKERILFLDASFVLFHIIREGTFCIQVFRFGDALMQVLPVLALKAGLTLDKIIMGFSVSPVLICFVSYLVCGSVLKQYRFALIILLLNLLFTADTFYWPISQVPQGMCLLMVVFALTNTKRSKNIRPYHWILITALLLFLAFFHPLMIVATAYTAAFFIMRKDGFLHRKIILLLCAFFFLFLAVKMIFFTASYDRHAMSGLKNFIRLFPGYFTLYSDKQFLRACLTKYYWIPIISAAIIYLYAIQKETGKLFFFIATVSGYLLLVNVSYPDADTPKFYIENLYLPLALFLALPFVFDVVPVLKQKKLALPVLALIIVTGCVRLYTTHTPYTARLQYERQFLKKYGDRKMIVSAQKTDTALLQMLWGTAYEFVLLSSSEQGHAASIVIDDDPHKFVGASMQKKALAVTWDLFPYSTLDPRYFHFADTATAYIIDPPLQ